MARRSVRIEGAGRSELVVAAWVALGAIALVYVMLLIERQGVSHALHIVAPGAARPGSEVAVEAYVFDRTADGGVPVLVRADVEIELRGGERSLSTAPLIFGALDIGRGSLVLPDAEGGYVLRARARVGGVVVATAESSLRVASDAEGSPELSRTAPLLMHFSLGPVVVAESALPPPRFDALVQSGVCVPDEPCTLVVNVGAVGYDVDFASGPLVSLRGAPRVQGSFAALTLVVAGPEGEGELIVRQAGVEVARRSVRLPMALATPWLGVDLARARDGTLAVEVVPPPGRTVTVLDVFSHDQWMRSVALEAGSESGSDLLGAPLAPGVYRIEARADPFRTERVTSRVVRVGPPDSTTPAELRGEGLGFEFAAADAEIVGLELPAAVSGLDADRAALEAGKRVVRYVAFVAMALAMILVVVAVARRGVIANAQAGALLREAGARDAGGAQKRARLTLILAVAMLAFAFASGAAIVMARAIVIGG